MNNIPEVKLGIIAVSRDCFPIALSTQRRKNIVAAYGHCAMHGSGNIHVERSAVREIIDAIFVRNGQVKTLRKSSTSILPALQHSCIRS